MAGVCPATPARSRNTYNDTPPVKDQYNLGLPLAAFNVCGGGTTQEEVIGPRPGGTTSETTVCCPSPGPVGPAGAAGEGYEHKGDWTDSTAYVTANSPSIVNSDTVYHNGSTYVCKQDHTASATDEPGVGGNWTTYWDLFITGGVGVGGVTWRGVWDSGSVSYNENDYVTHNGASFIAQTTHVSSELNEPDPTFDYEGGSEWILASSTGLAEEEKGWFDNLIDGTVDWITDIENWGLEDYIGALAIGAGVVWVGNEIEDMFTFDGEGDGQADSVYSGDQLYSTPFTAPYLPELVSKVCDWCGITQYDVSLLPNTEVNSIISSLTQGRNILNLLSQVYFFDMVDSGGTLKFIPRGNPTSVKTLTESVDLGWTKAGSMPPPPVSIKRYQDVELPRKIELQYSSDAIAYNTMVQTATLETFTEGRDIKISVPLTLTDQEAYEIAEKTIVNSHIERMNYGFTTTYKHIDLEPGDIITLENIGDVRILRIDEDRDAGLLTFSCVDASFNSDNYAASGVAAEPPQTYEDAPVQLGYSAGITVEIPPLDSSDTNQRFTIAPHGYNKDGWPGSVAYVSTDGGVSYNSFATIAEEATWGIVASAIQIPFDHYGWDETDVTITVELKTGTLSSYPEVDVLNGKNWALIGDEIVAFKNATLIAPNTYELTGLLRGRRGTEDFIQTHIDNEVFMLLDDALIEYEYPIDQKELTFYFKFVTVGSDISKATAYPAQPSQKSRRPWKPGNMVGTYDEVNDNWNLSWVGRNQFEGEMIDNGPVDNPDMFGGFVIQILDVSGSPQVVKRTITQQVTNYTYTEAEQIEDFGVTQNAITVRIAQIDRVVGPGYYNERTFLQ